MAEIYPSDANTFLETANDKLYAELDTLKTAMSSGYSPTFSYLYQRHSTAKLQLNAVSIECAACEYVPEAIGGAGTVALWLMSFTVRVHTDYAGIGANADTQKNGRILNSIINKLLANLDLGDGYWVHSCAAISTNETWDDSQTIGGQCEIIVRKATTHAQE